MMVGVAHRVADLVHELQPGLDRELVLLAVAIEVHALDQLHGEVGPPARCQAALDQPRDAGMLQLGENAPLLDEAADQSRASALDQLDGGPLLEVAVRPLGQEHGAHAALAQLAHDAPGPDAIGNLRGGNEVGGLEQLPGHPCAGGVQEAFRPPVRLQQTQDLPVHLGIVAGGAVEIVHLLVGGQIEQGVEDSFDALGALGGGGHREVPLAATTDARCGPDESCATVAAAPGVSRRGGTVNPSRSHCWRRPCVP